MGGCSSVEMAFWPDSETALTQLADVSNEPPMEWMELAVDPLR
jgi:hypothetical protein